MPSENAHITLALRNQQTLNYLLAEDSKHPEWIVTVAFYKALHIVEALFAKDMPNLSHGRNHEAREKILKKNRPYSHIWHYYRDLWNASIVARYFFDERQGVDGRGCFTDYMSVEAIRTEILGNCLAQVQKSASKFLSTDVREMLAGSPPIPRSA